MGDQPGAFAVLFAKESIDAVIATSAAPHSDNPELPTCPACDLETPDTYAQTHAGLAKFGGRRRIRSLAASARFAHSRSWGGHNNEGSTLPHPGGCILGRVTSLAM